MVDRAGQVSQIESLPLPETDSGLTRYHLYPDLCTGAETPPGTPFLHGLPAHAARLCDKCHTALHHPNADKRIPSPSIASGWDLGMPERANLPPLSWAESLAVSTTRVLSSALNIRTERTGGESSSYKLVL